MENTSIYLVPDTWSGKHFWSFWKYFAEPIIFFYYDLSIFGESKDDFWKNEYDFGQTVRGALHELISYPFMYFSNLYNSNPGRRYILIETPKIRSTLKTQGGDAFFLNNYVNFVSSFLIGQAICHTQLVIENPDFH